MKVLDPTTTIAKADAPPRHRLTHAENPARPGTALCGAKLTSRPGSSGAERCVVCLEMARRPYIGR